MGEHLVFVYGTLRKHKRNHSLMENADLIAEQAWTNGTMYDTGRDYPTVNVGGSQFTYGELYSVDDATLEKLNQLEGYNDDGEDNLFDRTVTTVYTDQNTHQAYIYVTGPALGDVGEPIEHNDWRVHQLFHPEPKTFYYFGYGSCMDDQRDEHSRSFFKKAHSTGILSGYRLGFTFQRDDGGRADIIETAGEQVEGKVYRLPIEGKEYLYRREGARIGNYRPIVVEVMLDGKHLTNVLSFTVIDKHPEIAPPGHYEEEILRGAKGWVSEAYHQWLQEKMKGLRKNG